MKNNDVIFNTASGLFIGGVFTLFISNFILEGFVQRIIYIMGVSDLIMGLGIFIVYAIIKSSKGKKHA